MFGCLNLNVVNFFLMNDYLKCFELDTFIDMLI